MGKKTKNVTKNCQHSLSSTPFQVRSRRASSPGIAEASRLKSGRERSLCPFQVGFFVRVRFLWHSRDPGRHGDATAVFLCQALSLPRPRER